MLKLPIPSLRYIPQKESLSSPKSRANPFFGSVQGRCSEKKRSKFSTITKLVLDLKGNFKQGPHK
jgi:hypothetical protein